jgi:hypothetical protein
VVVVLAAVLEPLHEREPANRIVRPETERSLHFGVNFVVVPSPELGAAKVLEFQTNLATDARGLTFETVNRRVDGGELTLIRRPEPLQVQIKGGGPGVGQLVVTAGQPARPMDDFRIEVESVIEALQATWPAPLTVIRRDCTIRHLYAVDEDHAFKFLWARRLHQSEASIRQFGRPVLGGGIRLVFPPRDGVADDMMFEVKVESYLRDPRQLFVDTLGAWSSPRPTGGPLDSSDMLQTVLAFAEGEVRRFILAETNGDG